MNRVYVVGGVLAFVGNFYCARGPSTSHVEPPCCKSAGPSDDTPKDHEADCARFEANVGESNAGDSSVEDDFEKGKQLLESCGETCMKSEDGGEERYQGLRLLHAAAHTGHLRAQSLYGRTLFGALMTTGDEAGLRDQYIDALYFLTLAAKRGDADVLESIPELAGLRVDASGALSAPLSEPLSGLDSAWVKDAVGRAQSDVRCFAK